MSPPAGHDDSDGPLEILEAGTGHGSLTLHLARAIHAANPSPPYWPGPLPRAVDEGQDKGNKDSPPTAPPEEQSRAEEWATWRSRRRAIVHTVDVAPSYSKHAEKIVRGFRRGLYAPHVDFYVSKVEDWVASQVFKRKDTSETPFEPFLSHVLLDMPSSHLRIENVAPVMRTHGLLGVFCPSVTQIGDCVRIIKEKNLPLAMDRVVELGTGISSGRTWDLRLVVKRASSNDARPSEDGPDAEERGNGPSDTHEGEQSAPSSELLSHPEGLDRVDANQPVMVCRPKVGERVVGGGFIGLWRRMKERE